MYLLPVEPSEPYQRIDLQLEDISFRMRAHWNARDNIDRTTGIAKGSWYLSFFETNNTPIITGVKVVLGTYLGRVCNHPLFKAGVFYVLDTSNQHKEAGLDDFGTRVQLRYMPTSELFLKIKERIDIIKGFRH